MSPFTSSRIHTTNSERFHLSIFVKLISMPSPTAAVKPVQPGPRYSVNWDAQNLPSSTRNTTSLASQSYVLTLLVYSFSTFVQTTNRPSRWSTSPKTVTVSTCHRLPWRTWISFLNIFHNNHLLRLRVFSVRLAPVQKGLLHPPDPITCHLSPPKPNQNPARMQQCLSQSGDVIDTAELLWVSMFRETPTRDGLTTLRWINLAWSDALTTPCALGQHHRGISLAYIWLSQAMQCSLFPTSYKNIFYILLKNFVHFSLYNCILAYITIILYYYTWHFIIFKFLLTDSHWHNLLYLR